VYLKREELSMYTCVYKTVATNLSDSSRDTVLLAVSILARQFSLFFGATYNI
jgi:hypothetical protein